MPMFSGVSASDDSAEDLTFLPILNIKVDGTQLDMDTMHDLLECTVENSLYMPDMCTLRFWDGSRLGDDSTQAMYKLIDGSVFQTGNSIDIEIGNPPADQNPNSAAMKSVFSGEITGIEADIAAHGAPTLVVRCLHNSHRLHRGRKSRPFKNVTYADILQTLISEVGLRANVEATPTVHNWVFQNNQTNWEFLSQIAKLSGLQITEQGSKSIALKKVANVAGPDVTLKWGDNLRSFRLRTAATHQVDQVDVIGWDRKEKQKILGSAETAKGIPSVESGVNGKQAGVKFGQAKMVVVDKPIRSQDEGDQIAQSILDDIGGEFLEAEGLALGQPDIKPNKIVKVEGVGSRYSGTYHVTATTHVYSAAEGYSTLFTVSGKRPSSLLSMLEDDHSAASRSTLGGNIVVALVTQIVDSGAEGEHQGCVKVKYPWMPDEQESFWAPVVSPMTGAGRGFWCLPEIDDEVLVAFEHGDIRRPYVLGGIWNGKDNPVEKNNDSVVDGKVVHRIFKTRYGHTMTYDDTDSKQKITIQTKNGHTFTISDESGKELIQAKTNKGHYILIDETNNKIELCDSVGLEKITIDQNSSGITMVCNQDFKVTANGKVSIVGQQGVEISTPMQLSASGGMKATLHSDAQTEVTAPMISVKADAEAQIDGGGMTTVKGGIVMIN